MSDDTITFALSLLAGALFVAWLVLTIVGRRMDRDEQVRQDGRLALVVDDPTADVAECGMVPESDCEPRPIRPHTECIDAWADGKPTCGRCETILPAKPLVLDQEERRP